MTSYKSTMDEPHPVDIQVGQRIKAARKLQKLSQTELAEGVGVSYQQIQKYEKGDNRVSASMLYDIAKLLNVSMAHFYEGLGPGSNFVEFTGKELSLIRELRSRNAFAANRNELIKALQNLDVKDKEIATHKAKIEYLEAEIAELKTPGRDAAMALVNAYMRECGDDGRLPPICDKERIAQAAMSYRAEIINNTEAFAAGLKGER